METVNSNKVSVTELIPFQRDSDEDWEVRQKEKLLRQAQQIAEDSWCSSRHLHILQPE